MKTVRTDLTERCGGQYLPSTQPKAVINKTQGTAINEAIRTSQFVRNKVLRYWMDNRGVGKKELYRYNTQLRDEFKFVKDLNSHACQASVENVERAINRFFDNCNSCKPGKKGYPKFKKYSRSVEYKQSGWKLHPTKRRITFTDKKGIGILRLLGKWNIHTFDKKLIKRVRIVKRADGFYVQFCVKVDNTQQTHSQACLGKPSITIAQIDNYYIMLANHFSDVPSKWHN